MDSGRLVRTGWALLGVCCALGWGAPVAAQAAKKPAGAPVAASKPAAKDDDDVIATVNGAKITKESVANDLLADQLKKLSVTDPNLSDKVRAVAGAVGALVLKRMGTGAGPIAVTRAEIVDWLFKDKSPAVTDAVMMRIQETVIAQAAKAAGAVVTDKDADASFRKVLAGAKTRMRQEGKSDAQFLDGLGMRAETAKRLTRMSLQIERLIQLDYEKKKGSPLGPADYIEARHIVVRVVPPVATKPGEQPTQEAKDKAEADAKGKIQNILAELKSGKAKFEDVAKSTNEDPTKFQEGRLGIVLRGQMPAEFDKAAFALAPQQLSDPVRDQSGWHIIRVDRQGKDISPAEREQALQQYVRGRGGLFMQQLMGSAKITNKCQAAPAMPGLNLGGGGEPD